MNINMKKTLPLLLLIFSLNALAVPNSILAIVNDELITNNQILAINKGKLSKTQKLAMINHKIDAILKMQEAKKIGARPTQDIIQKTLTVFALQNALTLDQLKKLPEYSEILTDVKRELSLEGLKRYINKNLSITLSETEISEALALNPETHDTSNSKIRIAQILIAPAATDKTPVDIQDTLAKEFLINLSNKIHLGVDFSSLAKLYSQDASYKMGGRSDWLIKKNLPETFSKALLGLKTQELSAPFKTKTGWKLAKIIEKRRFSEHLGSIKEKLMRQKQNAHFETWVKNLRKNAYVEIFEHKL
jgi:peptidyl-prolyl cis-trans isomerase SurA